MAGATVSTMSNALKKLYLPRLRSTLQEKTVLRSRLQSNAEQTASSGKSAIVPVNIRGSQAIGARSDGAELPAPQNQVYVESSVAYAYNYATIRVTHPVIAASKNDAGAWTKVVNAEMTGIERDFAQDCNRQDYGYGYGALAVCTEDDNGAGLLTVNSTQYIKIGQILEAYTDVSSSPGTQHNGNLTVSAINSATEFTVDGTSGAVANGDIIFREDARGQEYMGLMGIVDDASQAGGIGVFITTLQTISRSSFPEWNSNVFENSGTAREITAPILDDALLIIEEKGESRVSIGLTGRIQYRKIANLMVPDRRYTDAMDLKGGFKAITWSGVPIIWDKDCPIDANGNDMLFFLDEDHIQRYMLQEVDWDDTDGNILHRNQGFATYDATLFEYSNLGTDRPNCHGVIRDLSRS